MCSASPNPGISAWLCTVVQAHPQALNKPGLEAAPPCPSTAVPLHPLLTSGHCCTPFCAPAPFWQPLLPTLTHIQQPRLAQQPHAGLAESLSTPSKVHLTFTVAAFPTGFEAVFKMPGVKQKATEKTRCSVLNIPNHSETVPQT